MHPVPNNEEERLAELLDSRILESGASPEFDAVVELARDIFNAPTALISLVGSDRQWFKARRGFPEDGTPRSVAFCSHTILGTGPLVVPDALLDDRFRDNALVVGGPRIRFYAGVPLALRPGLPLGSICVIDTRPRDVDPAQIALLEKLATVTVGLIRECRAAAAAEAARAELDVQRRVLQRRERRFLLTESMAKVGGWEVDLRTGVMEWSEEMYAMAGIPLGTPLTGYSAMEHYPESERPRIEAAVRDAIKNRKPIDAVFEMYARDGRRKWIRHIGEAEYQDDWAVRLYGVAQDVTERHLAEQRLWEAANTDHLTGLGNRKRYRGVLAEETEKALAADRPLALMVVDVDHLKEVNDTLGHHFGDALIRCVADRLAEAAGEDACVFRLGGDEFTVVTSTVVDPQALTALGRRLIAAVAQPMDHEGQRLVPSVSIGGAIGLAADLRQDHLRRNADLAVYHAKEISRGTFLLYDAELRTTITRRIENVRIVSDALERHAVVPWYQPVVNLATGRIEGFEALARLRMPDGNLRSVGEFLAAVNDPRIGTRLSEAMFGAVADDLADWRRAGLAIGCVGLNVTLADLAAGDLEERLSRIFGSRDIPLSSLVVEVTEGAILNQHGSVVAATLERLRARGVIVSLDDFGTGFASLTHLLDLPVDTIKIDRSFVDRIVSDRSSDGIVGLLVDLGRKLGIDVVAEGIETAEQLERVVGHGCPFGQGYLFSRPLPKRDIVDFYTAFRAPRLDERSRRRIEMRAG